MANADDPQERADNINVVPSVDLFQGKAIEYNRSAVLKYGIA